MKALKQHGFWVILSLFLPALLCAQTPWENLYGPEGGTINSLAVHPGGDVYAIVNGDHIYRTEDDGATWQMISFPAANPDLIFCSSPGHLYVNASGWVWRSSNEGQNWYKVANYTTYKFLEADDGTLFLGTNDGVIRSETNGVGWEETNLSYYWVTEMTMGNSGELYAAGHCVLGEEFLWRSPDKGNTWEELIHIPITNLDFLAMAMLPSGTFLLQTTEGIRRTIDFEEWEELSSPALFKYWEYDGQLLATAGEEGLFTTTDEGTTWTPIHSFDGLYLKDLVRKPDYLFAAVNPRGVCRFFADELAWEYVNNGIMEANVKAMALAESGTLYCLADPNLFFSWLSGVWTSEALPGGPYNTVLTAGQTVWAISNDFALVLVEGEDGWTVDENFVPKQIVSSETGVWYALGKLKVDTEFLTGVYRSDDQGTNWEAITPSMGGSATLNNLFLAENGSLFVSYTEGIPKTVRLEDGETDWELIANLMFISQIKMGEGPDALFCTGKKIPGTETWLYKSTDGGTIWTEEVDLTHFDGCYEFAVNSTGSMFLNNGERVFRTWDSFNTWKSFSDASLGSSDVPHMLLADDDRLYISYPFNCVWRTLNPTSQVVTRPAPDFLEPTLYPNPAWDQAWVSFQLQDGSNVRLEVFNGQGKSVASIGPQACQPGQNTLEIAVAGWPAGVYFLYLTSDSGMAVQQFLIQR